MEKVDEEQRVWWKESVIYQVYPRSFNDSNGDGIGDIPGLIEKLNHLKELGVDIIWLCPMYQSPNDDNGYDISDYYNVMEEFGNMQDFDRLLADIKAKGMRLILDLVVNHSSDEHRWFVESRKSKNNPFRDYYIWRKGNNGNPPNDYVSFFSGSAWEYDPQTDEYYLHYFTRKQPDLNWENPTLREEVYKLMRFWLDKGIDGFRMDVIPLISKDTSFPDFPDNYDGHYPSVYANGPRVHEFLQEMNKEVLSRYDMMTVGEGIGVSIHEANDYVGKDRNELNMIFHFDHMSIDREKDDFFKYREWTLPEFKEIFTKWDEALGNQGWNSIYLGNHDFPRMVSRFGNDKAYRKQSAKALATLLLTLRGTPYIYQGDEIGMTNVAFSSINDYQDVQTVNAYREVEAAGGDTQAFLEAQHYFSRDNARTPMQWDNTKNAGFTDGEPWLKVNPNYEEINVAKDKAASDSIFQYYQQAIALRKEHLALVYGQYEVIQPEHKQIYAYTRKLDRKTMLVLISFSDGEATMNLPEDMNLDNPKLLLKNTPGNERELTREMKLSPYEALVYRL